MDDHKTKRMGSVMKFLIRYAQEDEFLDLTSSDVHLFLQLKKHLGGKKSDDDDEMQEEVMTWFIGLVADCYDLGIQKLVPTCNKCLDNASDYVVK